MTRLSKSPLVNKISIFIFALATYWLFGRLGLLFAIPPGYATAIFPAAGIGLAVVLLYGRWAAFGVWVAATLLYLPTFQDLFGKYLSLQTLLPALLLGFGAYLQALLSVCLIRRYVSSPLSPSRGIDIFKFMFMGAVVGSTFNSFWSLFSLNFLGIIPQEYFSYSFLTWISGNSIGVLIFAPLSLILLNKSYIPNWQSRIVYSIPLLLSFTLAGALYFTVNRSENYRHSKHFQERADKLKHNLSISMKDIDYSLSSLQSFFNSSDHVTQIEFEKFTASLFRQHPSTIILEWAPRIGQVQRQQFEAKYFPITETNSKNKLIPVTSRSYYFPILYIEPGRKENKQVLGFDIHSRPQTNLTVEHSCNSGKAKASFIKTLIQGGQGFLIYRPVYPQQVPAKNYSCDNVKGFVIGIYSVDKLVKHAIKEAGAENLNINIYEPVGESFKTIYNHKPGKDSIFINGNKNNISSELSTFSVPIINHQWLVRIHLSDRYFLTNKAWSSWLVLFFGMLFTAILSTFTLTILGQNQVLQDAVQSATNEIKKQRLMVEEEARLSSLGQMAGSVAHEINNPLAIIQSYAELLSLANKKGKLTDQKLQGATQKILETVERIAKIVKGLRTISSEGKREVVKEHNLEKIVEETLVVCKQRFKNNRITLEYNIDPSISVLCNAVQFSQVLINLLNNSFHALENLPTKWVKIEAKNHEKYIDLHLSDSGAGIDPAIRNKIFDPFFTTKTVNIGSGLGLSISRQLMRSQNGDLLYDPNAKNTKFIIRIPMV